MEHALWAFRPEGRSPTFQPLGPGRAGASPHLRTVISLLALAVQQRREHHQQDDQQTGEHHHQEEPPPPAGRLHLSCRGRQAHGPWTETLSHVTGVGDLPGLRLSWVDPRFQRLWVAVSLSRPWAPLLRCPHSGPWPAELPIPPVLCCQVTGGKDKCPALSLSPSSQGLSPPDTPDSKRPVPAATTWSHHLHLPQNPAESLASQEFSR